jgi:uncharacterized membrane protein YoaK (UPF0700 family)
MTATRFNLQAGLLTVVAGMADAVGYISLGGIFAANMTGNTVLAGIAVAEAQYGLAGRRLLPLLAFFLGALLARLLLCLLHKPSAPLLLEAALLAVAGFAGLGSDAELMIVALAIGLQASAITHFGGSAVSTVAVTSTLARMADATLDRLWPAPAHRLPSIAMPPLLALSWLGYLLGAVAGGLLLPVLAWPLLVPAGLLLVIVVTTL